MNIFTKRSKTFSTIAAGLMISLSLAACSGTDPLAEQANAGDNKNYIAGDGSVTEYGAAERKPPVEFTAALFDGKKVDSANFPGHVTVLNFWYAACAPCRSEAPGLQALSKEKPLNETSGWNTPASRTRMAVSCWR